MKLIEIYDQARQAGASIETAFKVAMSQYPAKSRDDLCEAANALLRHIGHV